MYLYHNATFQWQVIAILQCGKQVVTEMDFGKQIRSSTPVGIKYRSQIGKNRTKKPNFFSENTLLESKYGAKYSKFRAKSPKIAQNRPKTAGIKQKRLESSTPLGIKIGIKIGSGGTV